MYIDFHTHIIPEIDDGAKDVEMSLAMLCCAQDHGAETVILTPHISSTEDFDEFLKKREEKVALLRDAMKKEWYPYPEILTGAEVLLDGALSERENVSSLCIEDTELLLLELPYAGWTSWYNNEIYNIMSRHNVTPVMAHIERYIDTPKDLKKLSNLISFGVKFQINASSFLSFRKRRVIRAMAAEGMISAIASDSHNMSRRSPDITRALSLFKRNFGDEFIDYLYDKSTDLLEKYRIKEYTSK